MLLRTQRAPFYPFRDQKERRAPRALIKSLFIRFIGVILRLPMKSLNCPARKCCELFYRAGNCASAPEPPQQREKILQRAQLMMMLTTRRYVHAPPPAPNERNAPRESVLYFYITIISRRNIKVGP
jgi:hypothetical protein